jgi:hypothetical protein
MDKEDLEDDFDFDDDFEIGRRGKMRNLVFQLLMMSRKGCCPLWTGFKSR